jgi:dGTPase
VHDAEDFYRAGFIPLDRLSSLPDDTERKRFFLAVDDDPRLASVLGKRNKDELKSAFQYAVITFPIDERYRGTRDQRARLRYFSSGLIGRYVDAIRLNRSDKNERFVVVEPLLEREVTMWKALTWHYVILNPALATQQYGQRRIIRELFEIFHLAAVAPTDKNLNIFPFAFREELARAEKDPILVARVVADLIAGMDEKQIFELYQRLTGGSIGSVMDAVG